MNVIFLKWMDACEVLCCILIPSFSSTSDGKAQIFLSCFDFFIDGNKCPEASDNSFDLFESTQAMAPKSGTNWITALVLGITLGLLKVDGKDVLASLAA